MKPNEVKRIVLDQPYGTQQYIERIESERACQVHFDIDVALDTANPLPLYIHIAGVGAGAKSYSLELADTRTFQKVFTAVQTLRASGNAYIRLKANVNPDHIYRLTVNCPPSIKKRRLGIFPYYDPPLKVMIGVYRSQQVDLVFP